jgi:hypothetical protein
MADAPGRLTNQELEQQLVALGKYVAFPSATRLAQRVHTSLLAEIDHGQPRESRFGRIWARPGRRAIMVLAMCLALVALVLAVSPGARAAVTGWFHIRGVEITRVPPGRPAPSPVGTTLQLGHRTTLAAAQKQIRFSIGLPRYRTIGRPDDIYIGGPLPGQVALVYRARVGVPAAPTTGVALLITEFRADLAVGILKKLAFMGTRIENTSVAGAQGVWLSGTPHFFGYAMPDGSVVTEPLRLAGNTLLWQRGDVTYRIEGQVPKDIAVRIASSIH